MQHYQEGQSVRIVRIRCQYADSGFTLIELVIAMAISGITLCIAIWGIATRMPDYQLKTAVRNLKSDMHAARMAAIQHNAYVVSEFDAAKNRYLIYVDDGAGDPSNAHNYAHDEGEATIRSVDLHPHLNITRAQFGAVVGQFAFNSRGAMDGLAGGIYMSNRINSYRGVTVSRIGKITVKASEDGSVWHRIN